METGWSGLFRRLKSVCRLASRSRASESWIQRADPARFCTMPRYGSFRPTPCSLPCYAPYGATPHGARTRHKSARARPCRGACDAGGVADPDSARREPDPANSRIDSWSASSRVRTRDDAADLSKRGTHYFIALISALPQGSNRTRVERRKNLTLNSFNRFLW